MTPQEQPDSQAGDKLDNILDGYHIVRVGEVGATETSWYELKQELEAYAERLATNRAIEELKAADGHCGFDKGNSVYLNDRIAALSTTITKETTE